MIKGKSPNLTDMTSPEIKELISKGVIKIAENTDDWLAVRDLTADLLNSSDRCTVFDSCVGIEKVVSSGHSTRPSDFLLSSIVKTERGSFLVQLTGLVVPLTAASSG